MTNTYKLLNQNLISPSFYENFQERYYTITENENDKISSASKNDELISFFIEAISFIKKMTEYNHSVFHDPNINYKEDFPQSNLYKNLSSESFSSFTKFTFQKIKECIADEDFYQKFEPQAYSLIDIKDNELNFSDIKNSYLFPLKERLIKISKHYFTKQLNNKNYLCNYDIFAINLQNYNIFETENTTDFSSFLEKKEKLDDISKEFEKEPNNFKFFEHVNFNNNYYVSPFGEYSLSKIISFPLYLLSKNIGSEENKLNLTKQVIKHFQHFSRETSNSLINYIPLHRLNLVNSNIYDDLRVVQHLTPIQDLNIYHFNDKLQKFPQNKILCEALENIFRLNLDSLSEEDKTLLLHCSLELYFGLNNETKKAIYNLSHSLSNFLNYNNIQNIPSFDNSNFYLDLFIIKDTLINDKKITPQELLFKLKSEQNENVGNGFISDNIFFNNSLINQFLNNEDSSSFLKFSLYSYLQFYTPSFILESNYKQKIYDDVLTIKNYEGVTFEEFLLYKKNQIYQTYDKSINDYFFIINNSSPNIIFNAKAEEYIKNFSKQPVLIMIPLLEYCHEKNNNVKLEELSKLTVYKPFHNFTKINFLEASLYSLANLNKNLDKFNYEQLNQLSLFIDELFIQAVPKLIEKTNTYETEKYFEKLRNNPLFNNFTPIINFLKFFQKNNLKSFKKQSMYSLYQECAETTMAKINYTILSLDKDLSENKPKVRTRARKF